MSEHLAVIPWAVGVPLDGRVAASAIGKPIIHWRRDVIVGEITDAFANYADDQAGALAIRYRIYDEVDGSPASVSLDVRARDGEVLQAAFVAHLRVVR